MTFSLLKSISIFILQFMLSLMLNLIIIMISNLYNLRVNVKIIALNYISFWLLVSVYYLIHEKILYKVSSGIDRQHRMCG